MLNLSGGANVPPPLCIRPWVYIQLGQFFLMILYHLMEYWWLLVQKENNHIFRRGGGKVNHATPLPAPSLTYFNYKSPAPPPTFTNKNAVFLSEKKIRYRWRKRFSFYLK